MNSRPAVEENVTPNLIPMVDIMFLLLLFLMLGADMGRRELEDVVLPTAGAAEKDACRPGGYTVVNVYHSSPARCAAFEDRICGDPSHWKVGVRGIDYDPEAVGALLRDEAGGAPGDRTVKVRDDRSARYEPVGKVLEACARAGIRKVEIGAAGKE